MFGNRQDRPVFTRSFRGLATLLAMIFFLHTFVIPFAGSDLVLCVGENGHLAFELASRTYHHSPPEPVALLPGAQSHTYDLICKDLGLANLNNQLTIQLEKKQLTRPALPILPVWTSSFQHVFFFLREESPISSFPIFLATTILLI